MRAVGLCCTLVFAVVFIAPAQAADKARVLTIALFVSGIGLKFGSVFVGESAQESYNEYLSTAVQSEISDRRDDYTGKRDLGLAMSRTGVGFVGLAVIISVFDQLDLIGKSSEASEPTLMQLTPRYNARTHETALMFQRRF